MKKLLTYFLAITILAFPTPGWSWHDETHLAIAKAAGYAKWYNAVGADMAKIKAGNIEAMNHYVSNPAGTVVTPEMVMKQVDLYNTPDDARGHLYGAILGALRDYRTTTKSGKYAEYHLAFAAHYIGDLSQPLHNTLYNTYNKRNHTRTDATIDGEVLDNIDRIKIFPIKISGERDLAREVARIANQSIKLGYQLEKEGRLLTEAEAYQQISLSASLFKAVLAWLGKKT